MWKLKGCPRCGGDVFIDRDLHDWYEQCLQCGYRSELESIVEVRQMVSEGNPRQAQGSTQIKR